MANRSAKSGGMRRTPRQARSQERVKRILDMAEKMFIAEGYHATTTKAIATAAQVPIGTLYQFFPDKYTILKALNAHYMALLHQQFKDLDEAELVEMSLSCYADWIIDTLDLFFRDYPGYHAIFLQVEDTVPGLAEIEADSDAEFIAEMKVSLSKLAPDLEDADYDAIAFVLVKTIGTLLWISLSQDVTFRQRLVAETKRLTINYLKSYL